MSAAAATPPPKLGYFYMLEAPEAADIPGPPNDAAALDRLLP